jgi:hypothetical protein
MPIDCGFDEFGRKECQRYCHVDFAGAASSAVGDAVGRGGGIIDELLEPTWLHEIKIEAACGF